MNELQRLVAELNDGTRTYRQIAEALGRSKAHIEDTIRTLGLPKPPRDNSNTKRRSPEALAVIEQIRSLSDGQRTSHEIASIVGTTAKYVQAIALELSLPRPAQGARIGDQNPAFVSGRKIDRDGYVLVRAPLNHPLARKRKNRNYGLIYEHRLVVEQKLGRYLLPNEVVDHVDGLRLHNHPDNLRVFASNADHLRATISGQVPAWSEIGHPGIVQANRQLGNRERVDSYRQEKERGDIRLRQILLAWLRLEEGSPYLLGTHHWLERAGIADLSRSSLELHLEKLCPRLAQRLVP